MGYVHCKVCWKVTSSLVWEGARTNNSDFQFKMHSMLLEFRTRSCYGPEVTTQGGFFGSRNCVNF